jgi:hypothetical protein
MRGSELSQPVRKTNFFLLAYGRNPSPHLPEIIGVIFKGEVIIVGSGE